MAYGIIHFGRLTLPLGPRQGDKDGLWSYVYYLLTERALTVLGNLVAL